MLFGSAMASKAVTFTALAILLVPLTLKIKGLFRRSSLGDIAAAAALFGGLGVVPYVTAWILTGNPVFPFFNAIFASPLYLKENFQDERFGRGISWDVIYDATFHTETFMEALPGAVGFQWLLLFVPALLAVLAFRRRRAQLLFAVGCLTIILAFEFTAYLRYVFPSFAWVAAGIGVAASAQVSTAISKRMLILLGALVVALNLTFFNSGTNWGALSLRVLASPAARETYIRAQIPIRHAVELVNRLNVDRKPVAVFSLPMTAPLQADALYPNWYNYRFQNAVAEANSSGAIATLLANEGVEFLILDDNWGSAETRQWIEDATENVAKFGAISVRKRR